MSTKSKHTPLPWVIIPGTAKILAGKLTEHGYEGHEIAWPVKGFDHAERKANAEFICLAVNSHAALVEALEAFVDCPTPPITWAAEGCLAKARAALALAKETK